MEPEKRTAQRRHNIRIDETSGVDHPAHGAEGWMVMKSADSLRDLLEKAQTIATEEDMGDTPNVIKVGDDELDLSSVPEGQRDLVKSLARERDDALAKADTAPKDDGGSGDAGDDLAKALEGVDETIRKAVEDRFEDLQKSAEQDREQAVEARRIAEAERDKREERDRMNKAKEDFTHLPVPPTIGSKTEDIGSFLHRLEKLEKSADDDLRKSLSSTVTDDEGTEAEVGVVGQLTSLLKAVNGQLESAEIFGELGSSLSEPAEGSAEAKAESLAKARQKDDPELTKEQALAKVLEEDRDLYKAYRREQREKQNS